MPRNHGFLNGLAGMFGFARHDAYETTPTGWDCIVCGREFHGRGVGFCQAICSAECQDTRVAEWEARQPADPVIIILTD